MGLTSMSQVRQEIAGLLRDYRFANLRNVYEGEILAAKQNFQSEKVNLYDSIKNDIEEKIRKLEEDRNNVDIASDLWLEQATPKGKKGKNENSGDSRKKPVTVSGPFIVYMLREDDILEDWAIIKKSLGAKKVLPNLNV